MSANYSQTVRTIAEAHLLGDSIGLNYNVIHDSGRRA